MLASVATTLAAAMATGRMAWSMGRKTLPMERAAVFTLSWRTRSMLEGELMVLAMSPCAHETWFMMAS